VTSSLHTTFGGSIPEYYDRCVGAAWFGPFGRALAERVPMDPGGDVLEIACGTGLVTRSVRERLVPSRKLVATDLSKPMLDYASAKLSDLQGIEWREADGTRLPFGDGGFGAVVCALGVMFMPDKQGAFSEAHRVLKPGGMYALSTWDRIEENICAQVYAETIESLFPGDEEVRFRLPWSMHDERQLRRYLEGAGFGSIVIEKKRLPVTGDARTIATGQVRGTPRGSMLEKKGMSMEEAIDRVTVALGKVLDRAYAQALLTTAIRS
jgi:SAM-dependent methyltransferase